MKLKDAIPHLSRRKRAESKGKCTAIPEKVNLDISPAVTLPKRRRCGKLKKVPIKCEVCSGYIKNTKQGGKSNKRIHTFCRIKTHPAFVKDCSSPISKDLHGDAFFYAFDDSFRLLYLELKEISGAML